MARESGRNGGVIEARRRILIQQEVPLGPRRHLRFERIVCGERAAIRGIIRWRVRRDASATESVPLEYKRFDASRATRGVCECLLARASFGESFCVFFVAAGRLAASESESCCA